MRFASLGSGSQGNALVVEAGRTKLLLDCGFSTRTTVNRLARLGVLPEEIGALLLTHEHGDHVSGAFRFARRYRVPVVLTHGTFMAVCQGDPGETTIRLIDSHSVFAIDDLEVRPFPVPHDAREPVQFAFSEGSRVLGVLTDTGGVTQHIVDCLHACDALVLECNHDQGLLKSSSYPPVLKRRIAGPFGHLENAEAAALLGRIDSRRLQHLVAAHLSEKNNHPSLAVLALARAMNCSEEWIGVASQKEGLGWRQIV